ncbi:MAG: hypothetical protein JW850_10015 [Thermoflexales bacterium]|nr:hypothetical protein [Thermoflexales bacterium]
MNLLRARQLFFVSLGVLACWLALSFALRPVGAQDTLPPTHDLYADANRPDTVADDDTLFVAYSKLGSLQSNLDVINTAYLQFAVTRTEPATYSALVLNVVNNLLDASSVQLSLYAVSDTWDEATLSYTSTPPVADLLQTISVTQGHIGPLVFGDGQVLHPVGMYIERERAGDGLASFMLTVSDAVDPLLLGALQFEDREGSFDGVDGDEPYLELHSSPTAVTLLGFEFLPLASPWAALAAMLAAVLLVAGVSSIRFQVSGFRSQVPRFTFHALRFTHYVSRSHRFLLLLLACLLALAGLLLVRQALAAPAQPQSYCLDPVTPRVRIQVKGGRDAVLSWQDATANNGGYAIWRDSDNPYFEPKGTLPYTTVPARSTTFVDRGVLDAPDQTYYYVVQSSNICSELSRFSNRVGVRSFGVDNRGGRYSLLSLSFANPAIVDAAGLADYLGWQGSQLSALLKWEPDRQDFRFFAPPKFGDNFGLQVGDAVFIKVESGGPALVSLAGDVAASEHRLTPSGFSGISLPAQRHDMIRASDVISNITCARRVIKWDESSQGFTIFDPADPRQNFTLKPGSPFLVDMDSCAPPKWPADLSQLNWAQSYTSLGRRRNVLLQWMTSEMDPDASYDVYRKTGGAGEGGWTRVANRVGFAADAATMEALLGPLTGTLYVDLAQVARLAQPFTSTQPVYDYLYANPGVAALYAEQYHQVAQAVGLAYLDTVTTTALMDKVLAYYVVPARHTGLPTHRPVCIQPSPTPPTLTNLVEAPVVPVPGDLGVRNSTRPYTAPERYNWDAFQSARRVDGRVFLDWDLPAVQRPPADPWACVDSPALEVAGYNVYRNGPPTSGAWQLANPTSDGGGVLLVEPGTASQYDHPDQSSFLFEDRVRQVFPTATQNAIYTRWYYHACAVDRLGQERACSADLDVLVRELDSPASPISPSVTVSPDHSVLTLTWAYTDAEEMNDILRFFVSRSPSLTQPLEGWVDLRPNGIQARLLGPTLTLSITDVPPRGTPYWYRVQVRDPNGNWSAPSAPVKGALYDRTPPKTPNLPGTGDCRSYRMPYTLHNLSSDTRQVAVYRSFELSGTWQLIKRIQVTNPLTVTLWDDYVPPFEIVAYYQVEAIDGHGNASQPGTMCAVLEPDSPPDRLPPHLSTHMGDLGIQYIDWAWSGGGAPEGGTPVTITQPGPGGNITTTVVVTLSNSIGIPLAEGETAVGWIGVEGKQAQALLRRTNDFLDTDRHMADLGSLPLVRWSYTSPEPAVEIIFGQKEYLNLPLVAVFRRSAIGDGQWMQVTPVQPVVHDTAHATYMVSDTSDLSPNQPYEYSVLAFSPNSYEVLGVWETAYLTPLITVTTPVSFSAPLDPAPSLPDNCSFYGNEALAWGLPARINLHNGWYMDVSVLRYSDDPDCPMGLTPDPAHLYGKATLRNGWGDSWSLAFHNISLTQITTQSASLGDGRVVATLDMTRTDLSDFTFKFERIEFLPDQANAEIILTLPEYVNVYHSSAPEQRSHRLSGVVPDVKTNFDFDGAISSPTDLVFVDENLPWAFHPGGLRVLPDQVDLLDLGNHIHDRLNYTPPAMTNVPPPDNNLALLRVNYTAQGGEARLRGDGLYGNFSASEIISYSTSTPASVLIQADGAYIDVEASRIAGGYLDNAQAFLVYRVSGAVTDYMNTESDRPALMQGTVGNLGALWLVSTPLAQRFDLSAGGRFTAGVTLNRDMSWHGHEVFKVMSRTATLYIPTAIFADAPTNALGLPMPAENAWARLPGPDNGELDPGFNLNFIHQSFSPVEVKFGCYSPDAFNGDMDLYVRRGGVSENLEVLNLEATQRQNLSGYTEQLKTYDVLFVDNLAFSATVAFDMILPYPSGITLSLETDAMGGLDENYCPAQGEMVSSTSTVLHRYWDFEQVLGERWAYSQDLSRYSGADLHGVEKVFSFEGTATVDGLERAGDSQAVEFPIVSEWFPNGDVGDVQMQEMEGAGALLQKLRVSGFVYALSGVKLSRYYSTLMDNRSLPSLAGIDLDNALLDLPPELLDSGGNLTPQSLKDCSAGETIGCGFVLLDGNAAVDYFGEVEPAPGSRRAAAAIPADEMAGKSPMAANNYHARSNHAPLRPPSLKWSVPMPSLEDCLEKFLPVKFMSNRDGGAFAGLVRDFGLLPGAEVFRSDLGVVSSSDRDGSGFRSTFGIFLGYSASQAAFRALAMHRPGGAGFDDWRDVEVDVGTWATETFGYSLGDGAQDDAVDLARDTWDGWSPVTDSFDFNAAYDVLEQTLIDLGGEDGYGVRGLASGTVLEATGTQLHTGMGQAVFMRSPGGDWGLDSLQFGAQVEVNSEAGGQSDKLLYADWVSLEFNRDREFIVRADNVSTSLSGDYDVTADLILLIGTAEGFERIEGGVAVEKIEISEVTFSNLGAAFGAGRYNDEPLFYLGLQGEGSWSDYRLGGTILFGYLYDSPVLRTAGFGEVLDKFGDEQINGRPATFLGVYLAVSGDFPLVDDGCMLKVSAGGEIRGWYFKPVNGDAIYGGQLRGSVWGKFACILSARGDLSLTLERVMDGAQSSPPPGWASMRRTCPAGGPYCTAFSGIFWVAIGVGFDCDPGTWRSWDSRWWGDSWCYTLGAVFGLTYIDPASGSNWDFDYDVDWE